MHFAQCQERFIYFMMPRPRPTAGQEPTKSRGKGTWWTYKTDTWWTHTRQTQETHTGRTRFGGSGRTVDVADTGRSHGCGKKHRRKLFGKNLVQGISSWRNLHTNRPGHSASASHRIESSPPQKWCNEKCSCVTPCITSQRPNLNSRNLHFK